MLLYETILFYNGTPSYYKVHQQESRYYFEAIPIDYYKHISFPNFYISDINGVHDAEGCDNTDLIEQAIEDIYKFSSLYSSQARLEAW